MQLLRKFDEPFYLFRSNLLPYLDRRPRYHYRAHLPNTEERRGISMGTWAGHTLKDSSNSLPALGNLDYSKDAEPIILAVDASLEGWGAALMSLRQG